jgi:pyruvate dehydrogenase E1 component alpha subunit
MHLTDVSVGAYGSFAIVGAHLPIATGFGFAAKHLGTREVCLCFFGDGTVNIGAFHEALNLAAIWQLPVIFFCENNLYGEYSPVARTTPIHELFQRGEAYAMRNERIDGNDVVAVYESVAAAAGKARAGDGPTLIEALTYRHKGHSRTDPATYRPKEEVEEWLAKDPIPALQRKLLARGVEQETIDAIQRNAEVAVIEHRDRAMGWPDPPAEARFEHVYS